jgi:hypothetical protein
MDGCWILVIFFSFIYAWCPMIIIKIIIFCISALFLLAGVVTMVSPDVNTIFLPMQAESVQEAHFARTYAGFIAAIGYLSMRFLYSSSKMQVGTLVMYIIVVMLFSKIFSFIYNGYTGISVITTMLGFIYAICLYLIQKTRKDQIDYNL